MIKEKRGQYVQSFTKVAELVGLDRREEAVQLLNSETLLAIDALQIPIAGLAALQKRVVIASSAEAQKHIEFSQQLMVGLVLLGIVIGTGAAILITRSITALRHSVWNLTERIHRSGARWGLWATR